MTLTLASTPLLADIRLLIEGACKRVASAVNAELTCQLKVDFGKGWSEQQRRHCMLLVEIFLDEQILSIVSRELSWSHRRKLIYIDAPLRHDVCLTLLPLTRNPEGQTPCDH